MSKFFTKPTINKVIDDRPQEIGAKKVVIQVPDRIKAVPVKVLAQDTLDTIDQVKFTVKEVIGQIKNANSQDPTFMSYYDYISSSYWNPLQLLENPKARPHQVNYQKAEVLEKAVYMNNQDPKAIHVQGLYQILAEANAFEYAIQSVWNEIDWKPTSPIGQFVMFQANSYLMDLLDFTQRVSSLPNTGFDSIQDLIFYYIDQVSSNSSTLRQDIEDLSDQIKLLKVGTTTEKADLYTNWAYLDRTNRIVGGTPFWNSIKRSLFYTAVGFVDSAVDRSFDLLNDILSINLDDQAVHSHLYKSMEKVLLNSFEKVEAEILDQARSTKETAEVRELKIGNSILKAQCDSNNQAVSSCIETLEMLKTLPLDQIEPLINNLKLS